MPKAEPPHPTVEGVELIGSETAFRGYFRIDVYRFRHRLFAGGMSPEIRREVFERGHAAMVLPYDPVLDAVVMIEQFRAGPFAAGDPSPWMIEAVAGIIDEGETPEEVVRRESLEEAGCPVTDLHRVGDYYPSPGGCSENTTLFVGRTDADGVGGIHGLDSEQEDIRVFACPLDDALARADRNVIRNAGSLIALYWLDRHRTEIRRRWGAL